MKQPPIPTHYKSKSKKQATEDIDTTLNQTKEKNIKNIIGIDYNFYEGGNYNIFGSNFGMKYIRKINKRVDVLATLGISFPMFPFGSASNNFDFNGVAGRITLVPCYVPLRRGNKTIQLGVGYITQFHSLYSMHGLTTQFNYYKNSKKRRFTIGTNVYINTMFSPKPNNAFLYGGGVGLFLGGFTGKKPSKK